VSVSTPAAVPKITRAERGIVPLVSLSDCSIISDHIGTASDASRNTSSMLSRVMLPPKRNIATATARRSGSAAKAKPVHNEPKSVLDLCPGPSFANVPCIASHQLEQRVSFSNDRKPNLNLLFLIFVRSRPHQRHDLWMGKMRRSRTGSNPTSGTRLQPMRGSGS
jgi:hypothetical protein